MTPLLQVPGMAQLRISQGLFASWPKLVRFYLCWAGLSFLLYGIFGKGYAYLGVAPLYVGELLLVSGFAVAVGFGALSPLLEHPIAWLLGCFWVWELVCTVPFVGSYGLDAVRDAVTWAYSLFAVSTAAIVLQQTGSISVAITYYKKFSRYFVVLAIVCAFLYQAALNQLPTWPGTEVTIPSTKCTDLCIHLAGVVCFVLVGFADKQNWLMALSLVGFAVGFSISRGGGIAFLAAVTLVFILYPKAKRFFLVFSSILIFLLCSAIVDFRIHLDGRDREISTQQLARNLTSVLGGKSEENDLDGTKEWRMEWWHRIFDYTLRGPYFWTGKGFGVNLTMDDGMERNENVFPGLRSPHNSHLTFLARSGVPGFILWSALQLAWLGTMLRTHFHARFAQESVWAAFFAWITAYWLAFMVNAAFDVALEGPVTGIPFWMVWGLGWGASLVFSKQSALSGCRMSVNKHYCLVRTHS